MISAFQLLEAPKGFCPNCNTAYDDDYQTQTFKGGKVQLKINRRTSEVEAYVNNEKVGCWEDVTVGQWSNILYTLQVRFTKLIG